MRMATAILSVLLILGVPPASANTSSSGDPDDVAGRLDIKRITHGHARNGKLWHKVAMERPWGRKALAGSNEIRLEFSSDREDRFDEVHVSVDLHEGKLKAWVFAYVEGSDYAGVGPSERIRLERPDRTSVKVFFARGRVDRRDRYVWSARAGYRDRDPSRCRETCLDVAPDSSRERLEHRL